jgi:hypothetical protein
LEKVNNFTEKNAPLIRFATELCFFRAKTDEVEIVTEEKRRRIMLCRKSSRNGGGSGSVPVYLNVYDLTPFNGYAYWFGLGVYHSGVQGLSFSPTAILSTIFILSQISPPPYFSSEILKTLD